MLSRPNRVVPRATRLHQPVVQRPGPTKLTITCPHPSTGAGSGEIGVVCRFVTDPLSYAQDVWVGQGAGFRWMVGRMGACLLAMRSLQRRVVVEST
jgi:hypothetical protein